MVDHCSLGDDLGSLPRYCIFNVYLILVRPRSNLAPLPESSVQSFIIRALCLVVLCFRVVLVLCQCCLESRYFVKLFKGLKVPLYSGKYDDLILILLFIYLFLKNTKEWAVKEVMPE